ncbi:protein rolling stone-like [Ciona intestinalis]
MCKCCGYEFQCKLFGFYDCKAHDFYESQWGKNKILFLLYRVIVFLYSLAWVIADVSVYYQPRYWIFLTNWTEVTGCLYFFTALVLAIYGYFSTNREVDRERGANWGSAIVWILINVAFSAALVTDLLYWALLSSGTNSSRLAEPFNVHSHAINLLLLIIDIFVTSYPIRLLHFIYPVGYGLVYTSFSLILHGSGFTSAIYSLLNWATSPGIAAAACFGVSFVAMPLSHLLLWGLYHLRTFIARKQGCISDAEETNLESHEMGHTNPVYSN